MLEEFEGRVEDLRIIPSRGGVFEVVVDDVLAFSKKATGRHGEYDDILAEIRKLAS
ncbi:MAG: Rdx family protein [Actinomycetota bacterium]|nr:Rdx family protein [Actinomycetota bacterium]